jgi:hypothetical protein
VIAAAPRQEDTDILRSALGVYVGRAGGPAVANSYMLRGFDAEHGQDIEFRVGGLPINMPSHIHGQGYADLSFLVADAVRELSVSEGVYDNFRLQENYTASSTTSIPSSFRQWKPSN